jgi:hypothetical protein
MQRLKGKREHQPSNRVRSGVSRGKKGPAVEDKDKPPPRRSSRIAKKDLTAEPAPLEVERAIPSNDQKVGVASGERIAAAAP